MTKKKIKMDKINSTAKGKSYGQSLEVAKLKMDYIREFFNGNYYIARCNMMADQIKGKKVTEKIDGCPKSLDLMRSEYALMKMQAINARRNAYFWKKDLIEKYDVTEEELNDTLNDYLMGKIVRDDYDEEFRRGRNKAKFIKSDK